MSLEQYDPVTNIWIKENSIIQNYKRIYTSKFMLVAVCQLHPIPHALNNKFVSLGFTLVLAGFTFYMRHVSKGVAAHTYRNNINIFQELWID
ncbi:6477_t:CDS:2 [Gigaspora rosea]|nr:6477_t:CDS:2 [Gigaspora rosea]